MTIVKFAHSIAIGRYIMTKKNYTDDSDIHLFKDAMKSIKKLKQPNRVQHPQSPQQPPKRQRLEPESKNISFEEVTTSPVTSNEALYFCRPGIQTSYFRKLKRGQIPSAKSIDLHRMTVNEARQSIELLITNALQQQIRCVTIIHGKGHRGNTEKPILKNKVNQWLRSHSTVLAFCSALPTDGGTGAVYVLLKNNNR